MLFRLPPSVRYHQEGGRRENATSPAFLTPFRYKQRKVMAVISGFAPSELSITRRDRSNRRHQASKKVCQYRHSDPSIPAIIHTTQTMVWGVTLMHASVDYLSTRLFHRPKVARTCFYIARLLSETPSQCRITLTRRSTEGAAAGQSKM